MTTLEGRTHGVCLSDRLKRVVDSTVGHLDDNALDVLLVILGVDTVCGSKLLGELELSGVDIDSDDAGSTANDGSLNDRKTNSSEAKDSNSGALLDLGGVDSSTNTSGDTTSEETNLLERSRLVHLGNRDLREDGVLREGGSTHKVVNSLSFARETRSSIGHNTGVLGGANLLAEVRLGVLAELALLALGDVERDDVVTGLHRGDSSTYTLNDTTAFVSKNDGKDTSGLISRESAIVLRRRSKECILNIGSSLC